MSFHAPWLLALLAIAIPTIFTFLHHKQAQRRQAPSLLLLAQLQTVPNKSPRGLTLQHWLALAISLLALAALTLVSAGPQAREKSATTVWLVLDNSASMAAKDRHGKTRFERALRHAQTHIIPSLDPRTKVGLVLLAPTARVQVEASPIGPALLDALELLSHAPPQAAAAGAHHALPLLEPRCEAGPPQQTLAILLTDAAYPWPESITSACQLELELFTDDANNLAISALSAKETDALGQQRIYVEALNTSDAPREAEIALSLDGRRLDPPLKLTIPAKQRANKTITLDLAHGKRLSAQLINAPKDLNALTQDDARTITLTPSPRARVLLITSSEESYIANALKLHPRVALTQAAPNTKLNAQAPVDLLILESPTSAKLPPARRTWAIEQAVEQLGVKRLTAQARPKISATAKHPINEHLKLDKLTITQAHALNHPGATTLWADGPYAWALAWQDEAKDQAYFATGFHPERSDLVLRIAFVNLIANLVEWSIPTSKAQAPQDAKAIIAQAEADRATQAESWLAPQRGPITAAQTTPDAPTQTSSSPLLSWAKEHLWRLIILLVFALLCVESALSWRTHTPWRRSR